MLRKKFTHSSTIVCPRDTRLFYLLCKGVSHVARLFSFGLRYYFNLNPFRTTSLQEKIAPSQKPELRSLEARKHRKRRLPQH